MKKILKGQKGYTLIELAIVIVIMGVMASIIIPQVRSYNTIIMQARDAKAKEALRNTYSYCQAAFVADPELTTCIPVQDYAGKDVELTILSNARLNWVAVAQHKSSDPAVKYTVWAISLGTMGVEIPEITSWWNLTQAQTDFLATLNYPPATPPEG